MIMYCKKCRYLFSAKIIVTQCPNCGKKTVCPASEAECAEYERIQMVNKQDHWENAPTLYA